MRKWFRLRRWHVLLVLAAWLAWITVVGILWNRTCLGRLRRDDAQVAVDDVRCQFPGWRFPFRGLHWSRPDALLAWWLVSAAIAVALSVAILVRVRKRERDENR